jgi:integrase
MVKKYPITQKNVGQFSCPEERKDMLYFVEAERGLALRCSKGGGKSWLFQYVSPLSGHNRRIPIGKLDGISVAQAKHEAQKLRGLIASGVCPYFETQERLRLAEAPKPATIEFCIDLHADRLRGHIKRPEERIRLLRRTLEPFAKRLIKDISRHEYVTRFEFMAKLTPYAANRAQAATSAMLSDLFDRGLIENHPLLRLKKRTKEIARVRIFTLEELKTCWQLAISDEKCKTPIQFRHIIAILALTGCRRNEISNMEWSEIDFNNRSFTLPAIRSKTGIARIIPLCTQAINIFEKRKLYSEGQFVFGDASLGKKPFSGFSKAWAMFKKEANLPNDLRIHDLRRSFSTYSDQILEAPIAVIEEFIGHLSGARSGIVGVYNRADYNKRMRSLAIDYGNFLENIKLTYQMTNSEIEPISYL